MRRKESYLWIMAFGSPCSIVESSLTRDKNWERPQAILRDLRKRLEVICEQSGSQVISTRRESRRMAWLEKGK
jgi:hypothetical protein